tara:strand:+ start:321 stop:857 length:537 start_codon:yes stop_codon:yes gene_type:complete
MKKISLLLIFFSFIVTGPELVIGEQRVEPGIVFIFEGAVKDHVMPMGIHLPEDQTHVHIEARVNWDVNDIPAGTPEGGFVPYLYINAIVENQRTGVMTFVDLVPHINLIDNFHYARNITLPGEDSDFYTVTFNIIPPTQFDLALHRDWLDTYGATLSDSYTFSYKDVYFEEICGATRK